MYSRTEVITPERAEELKKRCTGNYRKLSPARVRLYASDMKAGRWVHNGESIKITVSGIVADGQHRIHGVILSRATIVTEVIYDVPDDVDFFDGGTNRTVPQALTRKDVDPAARSNGTVGAATIFLDGAFRKSNTTSKSYIVEFVTSNAEKWALAYKLACAGSGRPVCKKAPVILASYILLEAGAAQDELAEFFEIVNTGFPKDGRESSPAIVLRNQLKEQNAADGPTESRRQQFCMTVEAYKDYSKGLRRRQYYRKTEEAEALFMSIRAAELGEATT